MIVLPWPDRRLSPNARIHWRVMIPIKKKAKDDAYILAMSQITPRDRKAVAALSGKIPITVTFYPPDARKRDDDNIISAAKYPRDSIAKALGVDDNRFLVHYRFMTPDKPGRVEVEIVPLLGTEE